MTFEECIQSIHEGSVINFKEYSLDRRERRHLSFGIEMGIVRRVFEAGEQLNRETLEEYYGTELEDVDYQQLSVMNCPRLAVQVGLNPDNSIAIKVLILNKDFYNTKLQEIEVTNEAIMNLEEPNYLLAQKGW